MPAILVEILEVCLIPLLGVLTGFLIKWIKAKSEEIIVKTDSDIADKYIQMVTDTITDCVIATNQTYVETLKKEGSFDVEAQKTALNKTLDAVLKLLSQEALDYLYTAYGDVNTYLINKIESTVNNCK